MEKIRDARRHVLAASESLRKAQGHVQDAEDAGFLSAASAAAEIGTARTALDEALAVLGDEQDIRAEWKKKLEEIGTQLLEEAAEDAQGYEGVRGALDTYGRVIDLLGQLHSMSPGVFLPPVTSRATAACAQPGPAPSELPSASPEGA